MELQGIYFIVLLVACWSVLNTKETSRGVKAQPSDNQSLFPYFVLLQQSGRSFCGAAAISDSWIITAAHCWFSNNAMIEYSDVRVLSHTVKSFREVSSVIVYSTYNPSYGTDDIAVVRLKSPFGESVTPIVYAKENSIAPPGAAVILVGWKQSCASTNKPEYIQPVSTGIVQNRECELLVGTRQICARERRPQKLCVDVIASFSLENPQLVGLSSSVNPKCQPSPAGIVVTAIQSYAGWIRSTTGV